MSTCHKTLVRCFLFLLLTACPVVYAVDPPSIAVASNLTTPMTRIAEEFRSITGTRISISYGSSGNIARQIVQGAPYQLFISADKRYVDFLGDQGVMHHPAIEFIHGPIGIFIADDSILIEEPDLASIINALMYRSYRRITFPNPEHAPYGVAAQAALQSAGLWAIEKNRILLADNAAQVIQYALSAGVDAAVIPYSFMKEPTLQDKGRYFPIPESWYSPVIQYLVLLETAGEVTRRFAEFLQGETSTGILEEYGYENRE